MLNLPRRHFLPWDRPLLPQAIAFLAGTWDGTAPLDLARQLIIVPTRQSGRRLRASLAAYAAARNSAVFPPRVVTPEALVADLEPAGHASRLALIVAWVEVLRNVELDAFREVFPVDPPERNFDWALRLAEQFVRLQSTLAENRLAIGDVTSRVAADFPETTRWAQLGELERRVEARLGRAHLRLPTASEDPAAVEEFLAAFDRVILLGTVDPLPATISLLGAQMRTTVEVVVFAPASMAGDFDAWGRPLISTWSGRTIDLGEFEQRVHLCADPSDQARRLALLAHDYAGERGGDADATARSGSLRSADGLLALGVADPDVLAQAAGEAARVGVAVFNPEGAPRRNGALYHLLAALGDGQATLTFGEVEGLIRCPDFLAYLGGRLGPGFSAARLLDELDTLRRKHLPPDLPAARTHARGPLADALAEVAETQALLSVRPFPHNLLDVLGRIFVGRTLDARDETEAALRDAATEWTSVLRECAQAAGAFDLAAPDWRQLALRAFAASRRTEEKPAGALELQGWLELLFEDAPHLVLAGFNDGFVPEAVTDDAFLPESLRMKLGLKTNASRFARDAYLLQALAARRAAVGRLEVLFGKTSAAGDPLRPSRLLLRCADPDLPARVAFLFRAAEPTQSHLPWTRAWRLRPRRVPVPTQVAVTALKRWLVCPFRFYLKQALRMEAIDAAKSEMDAFDFGTLCHGALEAMGRAGDLRDCTDAGLLREFLLARLDHQAKEKFGAELPLPLLIQLESARQRLARFAEVQARDRSEGWIIQAVEQPFALELGGLVVKGKIDRIDRHEVSGLVRVLDYKTSDSGVAPRAAHLRPVRNEEPLPEWATVTVDGRLRAWSDLQLPLYRDALAATWGGAITLGYATLPKAVTETAIRVWDDYTPELHEAARRCAEGVCHAIARGEFWPPNELLRTESDDFASLFHHGVAESIEWNSPADGLGAGSAAEGRR